MKHMYVAAAIFINDGKIFAAKRKNSGELALKWEFPGGKLEPKESGEEAIIREIKEELSTTITVKRHLMTVDHQYETFSLTLEAYLCTIVDGNLHISEHVESRWLSAQELFSIDWAAADIPIVKAVARILEK